MELKDGNLPGFGVFKLPVSFQTLVTHDGSGHGESGFLSAFSQSTPPGVYIIVSCRATAGQSRYFQNQNANYRFPRGTFIKTIENQNRISSRLLKRRRENKNRAEDKHEFRTVHQSSHEF